jgi:hypothetical protein
MRPTYRELPEAVSGALDHLVQRIGVLLTQGSTLEVAEGELAASLAGVGCAVAGALLASKDPGGADVVIDGQRHWQALRAEREYMSSFGRVVVERGLYRSERNGPTLCPMELGAGIVEGFWLPRAAKLAALCISDMTPARAESFFCELGVMSPSRSSLDRLPKALNKHWEANRETYEQRLRAQQEIPPNAVTVTVSLDGVMVPMRGCAKAEKKAQMRRQGRADKGPAGYREAACGAVTFYDAHGERLETRRIARMPEAKQKTLKEQLRRELEDVIARRPDLIVVSIADGAANNWDYLDTLSSDHQVVDYYHATEHLKRALDVRMGASHRATQAKFEQLRTTLRDDPAGVDKVIAALTELAPRHRADPGDYRTGINYFTRHRARMNYAELEAKHLPIGSGVIEGTCKSLASDRLKRAGMRWNAPRGPAVLTRRAWSQSGRFE